MSKPTQSSQNAFAFKTTWNALEIESGEETDEEVAEEPVIAPARFVNLTLVQLSVDAKVLVCSAQPAPPSKSAIKKAKAQARAEKRQQEKAARAAARQLANGKALSASSPTTSQSPSESPETTHKALEEPEVPIVAQRLPHAEEPTPIRTPGISKIDANGDAHHTAQPVPIPVERTPAVSASAPPFTEDVQPAVPVPLQPPPPPKQSEKPPAMANGTSKHALPIPTDAPATPQEIEKAKKRQSFLTRTLWTFIMIGGFISMLYMIPPLVVRH